MQRCSTNTGQTLQGELKFYCLQQWHRLSENASGASHQPHPCKTGARQ